MSTALPAQQTPLEALSTHKDSNLIQVKVKAGDLGLIVKNNNYGHGIEVVEANASSSLCNIIQPGDHIVSFDGVDFEREGMGVGALGTLLQRTNEKNDRILVFRQKAQIHAPLRPSNVNDENCNNEGNDKLKAGTGESAKNAKANVQTTPSSNEIRNDDSTATREKAFNEREEKSKVALKSKMSKSLEPSTTQSTKILQKQHIVDGAATTSNKEPTSKNEKAKSKPQNKSNSSRSSNASQSKSTLNKANSKSTSSTNQSSHVCDICNKPDGYKGLNMQHCKTCGIYVHEECYCLLKQYPGRKYPDWECWACACK